MTINLSRDIQELVYKTLILEINEALGLPTGSIKVMSPDPLFTNERTEEDNNIDETRFPLLSITPEKGSLRYINDMPTKQKVTYTSSGSTKSWIGDMEYEEQLYFCMETSNKRDFRMYRDKMLIFFNQSRYGILIRDDVLPEKNEYLTLVLSDNIDYDLFHAPFQSVFSVRAIYRIYQERFNYLFLKGTISGTVKTGNNIGVKTLFWND